MKKLYTLLSALLLTGLSYGQTSRLVLVEEFTGETCGPCAGANPGMNAILDAQPNAISLKYQNNIPSAGSNFYAYNTTDISNRTTFYANNYSPHAFIDGNYWNGNAASLTASQLNIRGNVMSPFSINVTHSFSPTHDIIYVHTVIQATQVVNSATLKARIAIAERDVYGYTSPNGESEYSHVMRKLLPTGTGTALPATWAIGDSVVIDEQWTIVVPTNPAIDLPLWPMLEAIVWVQDDSNKEIKQAGLSPAVVTIDPAIVNVTGVDPLTCAGSITPIVTITNNEPTSATSIDIEYFLDNQTPVVYNWTGSLAQGATANVTLNALTISSGSHTVNVIITNVNGLPDGIPTNNSYVVIVGQPLAASTVFAQDFTTTIFPPVNWINENIDGVTGWLRSNVSSPSGVGSAKIDFYNSPPGEIDVLYPLTPADLSAAFSPTLTFRLAHQRYAVSGANSNDRIDIITSTDCGLTWNSIWNKSGSALATVTAANQNQYTPTSTQWRDESVSLSAFTGLTDVLFAIKATSDYGNNAYIDNINLNTVTGIAENSNSNLVSIYPSPSSGIININVEKINAPSFEVTITNVSGKVIQQLTYDNSGKDVINIDLTNEANGNYFVKIVTEKETILKRTAIQK